MLRWCQGRYGKILSLGLLCLVLQQVSVPYVLEVMGARTPAASLLHLHTALLLAIAMLDRDRWVLVGSYVIVTLGWCVRARMLSYGASSFLVVPLVMLGSCAWMILCARWMGWPKAHGTVRVQRSDLITFVVVGLFVFPAGMALLASLSMVDASIQEQANVAIQVWFAKYFGVVVLTFPVVLAWCERTQPSLPSQRIGWALPLMLVLAVIASVLLAQQARGTLEVPRDSGVVLMDYRIILFAVLAWCMLYLRAKYSMLLLGVVMFVLVSVLANTAEHGGTPLGFINLMHLALELSILLIAMLYYLVISRDSRALSQQLFAESRLDSATGLPNLKALMHRVQGTSPKRREIGYLLLDQVDSLRTGFGLDTQVAAMKAVADRIADMVEPYYVGTGQFALLPRDAATQWENGLWESLVARVEQAEVEAGGQRLRLLPYMGVAEYTAASSGAVDAALLGASHLAFEARRHSEVRPLYGQQDGTRLHDAQRQQMYDAAEALACLRNERVVLYFQSIGALAEHVPAAGTVASSPLHGEVLCRLRNQAGELIMPSRFLRPIEAAGRGVELDLAVLKALFRQLRAVPQALPHCKRIGVNLTGQSLASASFQKQLRSLLAESPLPMSCLCFEITETAAISSTVVASRLLDELRAQGCSIAIDDFGVGMQSFERLKELPLDVIKIDGSFIRNVVQRGTDHALVQASVAVAKAFGAKTVAEFVEDEETVDCLRELGVDFIQGYLIAQPRPLGEVLSEVAGK